VSAGAKAVCAVAACIVFLLVGCAMPTRHASLNQAESSLWRGRLAVRIESDQNQTERQSLSAEFELSGDPKSGRLTLYTPLGTTAVALSWSANQAVLQVNGAARNFDSLDALVKEALGTEVPVAALFAWLAGDNQAVAGWSVDLSQQANGRITARRSTPAPLTELRLVLEK